MLLATRKLCWELVFVSGEAHALNPNAGLDFSLVLDDLTDREAEGDILQDGSMRKQGEALEDHREFVSAERFKRLLIEGQDVSLAHVDQARRRFDQSVEVADQGRLAGAGKTHDDEDFAFLDREVDVSETDRMTSLRQKRVFTLSILDQRQHCFWGFAEYLVKVGDPDKRFRHRAGLPSVSGCVLHRLG